MFVAVSVDGVPARIGSSVLGVAGRLGRNLRRCRLLKRQPAGVMQCDSEADINRGDATSAEHQPGGGGRELAGCVAVKRFARSSAPSLPQHQHQCLLFPPRHLRRCSAAAIPTVAAAGI